MATVRLGQRGHVCLRIAGTLTERPTRQSLTQIKVCLTMPAARRATGMGSSSRAPVHRLRHRGKQRSTAIQSTMALGPAGAEASRPLAAVLHHRAVRTYRRAPVCGAARLSTVLAFTARTPAPNPLPQGDWRSPRQRHQGEREDR
jgi:hypothetical protein